MPLSSPLTLDSSQLQPLVVVPSQMESSIIRQLATAEEEIFVAVASNGPSTVFAEKWTILQKDIIRALQVGHLSCETQALAFRTASMVNTLAESFLEFEQTHIALSVQFKDDSMQEFYARVCLFLGLSKTFRYLPLLTGFRLY